MLMNVFGFAENKEKATYALGYELTVTRNVHEGVLDTAAGFANARL